MAGPEFEVHQLEPVVIEPLLLIAQLVAAGEQQYALDHPSTPRPIALVGTQIAGAIGEQFNTAILKRHDPDRASDAFHPYQRSEFVGRMAVLSLNNKAVLKGWHLDAISETTCRPGTLFVCDSQVRHQFTRPLQQGLHHFLYFGYAVKTYYS